MLQHFDFYDELSIGLFGLWRYRSCTEVAYSHYNMASWKVPLYGSVIIAVVIVLLVLNFDYLPKRKHLEDLELSRNSKIGVEWSTIFPTTTAKVGMGRSCGKMQLC